jgi:hypothetical protein
MSNENLHKLKTHKDLDVWNKAMGLVERLYEATAGFPVADIRTYLKIDYV